jgi:hypothetical protein
MHKDLEKLEFTVMELGAEIFKLRQELTNINQVQENYVSMLTKLKNLLDDKGVICKDDIENTDYSFMDEQLGLSNEIDLEESDSPKNSKNSLH